MCPDQTDNTDAAKGVALLSRMAVEPEFAGEMQEALQGCDANRASALLERAGVKDATVLVRGGNGRTAGLQFRLGLQICITVSVCF